MDVSIEPSRVAQLEEWCAQLVAVIRAESLRKFCTTSRDLSRLVQRPTIPLVEFINERLAFIGQVGSQLTSDAPQN